VGSCLCYYYIILFSSILFLSSVLMLSFCSSHLSFPLPPNTSQPIYHLSQSFYTCRCLFLDIYILRFRFEGCVSWFRFRFLSWLLLFDVRCVLLYIIYYYIIYIHIYTYTYYYIIYYILLYLILYSYLLLFFL